MDCLKGDSKKREEKLERLKDLLRRCDSGMVSWMELAEYNRLRRELYGGGK